MPTKPRRRRMTPQESALKPALQSALQKTRAIAAPVARKVGSVAGAAAKAYLNETQKAATAVSNAMSKAGDMRLNKSGTVGTEPVTNSRGQRTTEFKFGKLGSFQAPVAPVSALRRGLRKRIK